MTSLCMVACLLAERPCSEIPSMCCRRGLLGGMRRPRQRQMRAPCCEKRQSGCHVSQKLGRCHMADTCISMCSFQCLPHASLDSATPAEMAGFSHHVSKKQRTVSKHFCRLTYKLKIFRQSRSRANPTTSSCWPSPNLVRPATCKSTSAAAQVSWRVR